MNTTPFTAALVLCTAALGGCAFMAVQTAPAKKPAPNRTEAALRADTLFWQTLHGGDYNGIGRAMQALKAAYLEAPNDGVTAAHVAYLHIWRLAEGGRAAVRSPDITDDAVMSRKYFEEAVRLKPEDARFQGFLGSALLAEGSIHQDQKIVRQGYYRLLDSIDAWPEFNLFTAGYSMSGQPADSARYKEALEFQWRNMEVCAGARIDRREPSYAAYMNQVTTEGPKRVCWNSWIAPHNFEGFFLNMGDMLVKSGDWETARKVYANARLSPDYDSWKFKPVLEARIAQAQANVEPFRAADGGRSAGGAVLMNRSDYACSACHQR